MSYPTPIINLDFVNSKQLGDKVAFSRLSPRIFTSRLGASITASDGVPCFDHDTTTWASKGLYLRTQETIESTVYAADLASVDLTQLKGAAGEALWNGNRGTIVVDFIVPSLSATTVVAGIGDNANFANSLYMTIEPNGNMTAYGVSQVGVVTANVRAKAVFAFDVDSGSSMSANGNPVTPNTETITTATRNHLSLFLAPWGPYSYSGWMRSIQLYNKRIDDAYLPALSAL